MTTRQEQMRTRLLKLVVKYPGKDAVELKEQGWTPRMHGSIRDAKMDGDIELRSTPTPRGYFIHGWHITDQGLERIEPYCMHMPDALDGTKCSECDAEDAHNEAIYGREGTSL